MTIEFVIPETFNIKVKSHGTYLLSLEVPEGTTDFTMSWSEAFALADLIGQTAMRLKPHISDPQGDIERAMLIRVARLQEDGVLVYFSQPVGKIIWTRNEALEVAQKITKAPDVIAEELIKSGRTYC